MSNAILDPIPFDIKPLQMTTGRTTNFKVVQPVVTTQLLPSRETVAQMTRPIAWSPSQSPEQSRDLSAHNHARLMGRPCTTGRTHVRLGCDLLRFIIAGAEIWTWPSTLLRPHLLVRSPTTFKIKRTICQRFICDSSYFVVVYRS